MNDFDHLVFNAKNAARSNPATNAGRLTVFERREKFSQYYYNRSTNLLAAALVVNNAREGKTPHLSPVDLGLSTSFRFDVALMPPFEMLCGMSLELLLKAISKLLNVGFAKTHDLQKLIDQNKISICEDQKLVLARLTHAIVWSGRYPVPKDKIKFDDYLAINRKADEVSPIVLGALPKVTVTNQLISLRSYLDLWGYLESLYWKADQAIHSPLNDPDCRRLQLLRRRSHYEKKNK